MLSRIVALRKQRVGPSSQLYLQKVDFGKKIGNKIAFEEIPGSNVIGLTACGVEYAFLCSSTPSLSTDKTMSWPKLDLTGSRLIFDTQIGQSTKNCCKNWKTEA